MSPERIVDDLLGVALKLAADRLLLVDIVSAIPVPHLSAVPTLLRFLQRISVAVPWFRVGGLPPWAHGETPSRLLVSITQGLRDAKLSESFTRRADLHGQTAKYPIYAALLEEGSVGPAAIEQLRALLVLCAYHWSRSPYDGGRVEALDTLASAIRGVARSPSNRLVTWLSELGNADSSSQFARLVDGFKGANHKGLAAGWEAHYLPILTEHSQPVRPAPPTDLATAGHPTGLILGEQPPVSNFEDKASKPARKRLIGPTSSPPRPRVRVISRELATTGAAKPERGEAPEDAQGTSLAVALSAPGKNLAETRTNAFLATQSIWTQNRLLLTEHPESLLLPEAQIVAKILTQQLADAAMRPDSSQGHLWSLLSLLTGRAAGSLGAVRILNRLSDASESTKDQHWDIVVDDQLIRLPVLTPEQPFKPDTSEIRFLEPTRNVLILPLTPEIIGIVRTHAALITRAETTAEGIQYGMETTCRPISAQTGLTITPGRIRRTLASMVQEVGRNLPATMLICGDPLGRSAAPLYYYSARVNDLAAIYSRAISLILESAETDFLVPTMQDQWRVGSRLLVTEAHVRQVARALGTLSHGGATRTKGPAELAKLHNSLSDHVAGMLLCVAGHRPSDELFALKRGDIDFNSGLAVFADKRVDPAHWTRIAVLAPILIRQLMAYFEHLDGLAGRAAPEARTRIHAALHGTSSFLFHIGASWVIHELTIDKFRAGLPAVWRRLPLNFGRTHLYTRGVEAGARPESLAVQLGHLDAVGLPWGSDGPTEPILLAAEVAPTLEKLAKNTGWIVQHGYPTTSSVATWVAPSGLRTWSTDIRRHESQTKVAIAAARAARRAQRRLHRVRAEADVLNALDSRAPILTSMLRPESWPGTPWSNRSPRRTSKRLKTNSLRLQKIRRRSSQISTPLHAY